MINFFPKLRNRSCKEVLGGYSKHFREEFEHFWLLNLSERFLHEKMDHFQTPKKTRVNLKVQNGPKKWSKKRSDRFRTHFLRKTPEKNFQSSLTSSLQLLFFNFWIYTLVREKF